ncbi:hypothetical protein LOD99_15295 [Oopsacas minuta]|uniref:MICOS complex subunit MIC10 n=1 Tax=Oopsacas minuta TaxID=111878 RepID=A0AAV7KCT0_9METZ|nr:hypothetical protein LOD99_15295 [Oopsacas minuta]
MSDSKDITPKQNTPSIDSLQTPQVFNGKGEVSHRIDNCIAEFLTRNSIGFGIGVLFNFLLYRKPFRGWPICLALGLASGYSIGNCQNSLKSAKNLPGYTESTTAEEIEIP